MLLHILLCDDCLCSFLKKEFKISWQWFQNSFVKRKKRENCLDFLSLSAWPSWPAPSPFPQARARIILGRPSVAASRSQHAAEAAAQRGRTLAPSLWLADAWAPLPLSLTRETRDPALQRRP
jgi:hypothetical protein